MTTEKPRCELPCPDPEHGETSRIGNRRSSCKTCNVFARRLERAVSAALREEDPERYRRVRERVEREQYKTLLRGQRP